MKRLVRFLGRLIALPLIVPAIFTACTVEWFAKGIIRSQGFWRTVTGDVVSFLFPPDPWIDKHVFRPYL